MATGGTAIQRQGEGQVLSSEARKEARPRLAERWPVYLVAFLSAAVGFWALAALVGGVLHCCASSAAFQTALAKMVTGI